MRDEAEKPRVLDLIRSSTLLSALTEAEISDLAAVSRVVRAAKGEAIWLAGANVDFFGLAGTGFVKMVRSSAGGSDVAIELMGPGQIFGLLGAISGGGCPLSAVAVTDLWYLRIPRQAILPIYEQNGVLKDRLVRRLSTRFHATVDLIARMSSGKVEGRIAAVLFLLSDSYGEREEAGMRLRVPLTRQEIGELAGTTVESTIRTMSRWQKQGLVRTEKGIVTLCDEGALEKLLA